MKRLSNQRGSVLLAVLATAGVLMVVSWQFLVWFDAQRVERAPTSARSSVELIRAALIGTIANSNAWYETVKREPQLACLLTHGVDCGRNKSGVLTVYAADGTTILSQPGSSRGFDVFGRPCDTFNNETGNDACPFQMTLKWDIPCGQAPTPTPVPSSKERKCKRRYDDEGKPRPPSCPPRPPTSVPPPSCISALAAGKLVASRPAVFIEGQLAYKPANKVGQYFKELDPSAIPRFRRGLSSDEDMTIEKLCTAMGGTWVTDLGYCATVLTAAKSLNSVCPDGSMRCCPPGTYFKGIGKNGGPNCENLGLMMRKCTTGWAMVGISEWGEFICGKF